MRKRFFGCGDFWRRILTKVESDDVVQSETISLRYESNSLNPDEKALYPLSRYGARRNVLIKVESSDEDLAETVSAKYESNSLNNDEEVRGFLLKTNAHLSA